MIGHFGENAVLINQNLKGGAQMKKLVVGALFIVSVMAHAGGNGLKPGLWEFKPIKQIVDGRDMAAAMQAAQAQMQQALANVPPEQRKQMEAMMQGRGMALPGGGTGRQLCISPAMASRDMPMVDPEGKCAPTNYSRSGNRMTFEVNCVADGRTMVGRGESVISGDTITSKMDMTMSDASGRHTMQSESQMKFISADCGAVKPIDEIIQDVSAHKK